MFLAIGAFYFFLVDNDRVIATDIINGNPKFCIVEPVDSFVNSTDVRRVVHRLS